MKRVGSSGKPLSEEAAHHASASASAATGALLYKNGFLVRKVHADSDGKRSRSFISSTVVLWGPLPPVL